MKTSKKRTTTNSKNLKIYVMYGFNTHDILHTGYYKSPKEIVDELDSATRFYSLNINKIKGFKKPEEWLKFINSDKDLNNKFKFHLVRVIH